MQQLTDLLAQQRTKSLKEKQAATGLKDVRDAYLLLIKEAMAQYQTRFAALSNPSTTTPQQQYEYEEHGGWTLMPSNATVEAALQSLLDGSSTAEKYSIGGNSYDAQIDPTDGTIVQQTNSSTGMVRKIRKSATKAPDDTVWRKHQLLFGSRAPIKLTSAMLNHLSTDFDYRIDDTLGSAYPEPCPQLAELAELFSSFGTGFKYVDAKGKLSQCETELLVKPAAISAWLAAARGRGYTAMRVCMHGSDLVGYDAIKRDPIGFSLVSQGRHAMAHGPGVYLGLSDHVTIQYNGYSGLKAGTALLCLLLTDEDMVKENGLYKTFTLNAPRDLADQSLETCIVVRELYLVLILGFVKAL